MSKDIQQIVGAANADLPELPNLLQERQRKRDLQAPTPEYYARRSRGLTDVFHELEGQLKTWGVQRHPSFSQPDAFHTQQDNLAQACKTALKQAYENDWPTPWSLILLEEVHEAMAEKRRKPLRAELVQVAAVAIAWMETLDFWDEQDAAVSAQNTEYEV